MKTNREEKMPTGIPGVDEVLLGGLVPECTYLVRGGPGSGKTTFGLHFLTAEPQSSSMFISFGETVEQLKENGGKLGLSLENINFVELVPLAENFQENLESYNVFSSSEVEGKPLLKKIIDAFDEYLPRKIFIDSLTQLRYLAQEQYQFRKQILTLFRLLTDKGATVLFTSEMGAEAPDEDLQFLSDGIFELHHHNGRRTFSAAKFRGSGFLEGKHDMRLGRNGMQVFPRLIPHQYDYQFNPETISSGVPELDELLHGGLERGTVTIISGPSGVGKTTLGIQFMKEAAGRGERSVIYTFEETMEALVYRCNNINIPISEMIEQGTLNVDVVEPLINYPDEFSSWVRKEVEEQGASIVMLDSLSGYKQSILNADLYRHIHALCRYLRNMGVTVLLINELEVITGEEFKTTEHGISYLSDAIILLRYLEVKSELRKAIGVLKKRTGDFEKRLRQFAVTKYGLKLGEPLLGLHGILRGVPELIDSNETGDSQ